MLKKTKVILQYILPKQWLTQILGWIAKCKGGWMTRWIIIFFIYIYKIDIQEAQQTDITTYLTFNDFFTRKLRKDARPINNDPTVLVLPADGTISQIGMITDKQIFQIKGSFYSLEKLLANKSMIKQFYNISFVIIYLAPHDYHCVHMPCNGVLREMLYIPGKLFSVNLLTTSNITDLFARNERLICLFDTNFGPMIQILVGAMIVGSIETVWAGTITPPRNGIIKHWKYPSIKNYNTKTIKLLKGEEMGRFKIGSTVINLFSTQNVLLYNHLKVSYICRVGQKMAYGINTK